MTYRISSRRRVASDFRPEPRTSAKKASLLFGTALGCSIAILAAGAPDMAWAADECGADVGGVAVCTDAGNPYPTGIDYTGDAGEDITVVLFGAGVLGPVAVTTATDPGVTAFGSFGYDASIIAYADVTIDSYGTGLWADSIFGDAYIRTDAGVTIDTDRTGILADATFGDATVDSEATITVDGDANPFGLATGIVANAFGGDASIYSSGDITVYTSTDAQATGIIAFATDYASVGSLGAIVVDNYGTGDAVGVQSDGFDGSSVLVASVDVYANDGDATGIDSFSFDNSGVLAGPVTAVSDTGAADGIISVGFDYSVVLALGAVNVDANDDAGGVTSVGLDGSSVGVSGDVNVYSTTGSATGVVSIAPYGEASIAVTGNVVVDGGSDADGLIAVGSDNVSVELYGNLTVYSFADDGNGIVAVSSGVGYDTYVEVDGTVDVYGYDYAAGIVAVADDDAYVNMAGNLYVDSDNDDADGIVVVAGDYAEVNVVGSVTVAQGDLDDEAVGIAVTAGYYAEVDVSGAINVDGGTAYGVLVENTGLGDTNVDVNNVYVDGVTDGAGIAVYADYDIYVDANNVATTGDNVEGIFVAGDTFDAGDTDIEVNDVSTTGADAEGVAVVADFDVYVDVYGTITTQGNDSDGVEVFADGGAVEVNVVDVYTYGDSANAVYVYADDGAEVNGTGTIYTDGLDSDGLEARTDYGDAVVTSTGSIETQGDFSTAIVAVSDEDNAYVNNSGAITTFGDTSYGVYAVADGDVDVINTATITTYGDNAVGIFAVADDGVATVDHTGTINTSGDYATGIYANGGDGVRIYNADTTVITSGYSASGIVGISIFDYVYIDSGTVVTSGDDSPGIVGFSVFDYVTVYSNSVDTGGADSNGITAISLFDYAFVDSYSVNTDGDDSDGIVAIGSGGTTVNSTYVDTDGIDSTGIFAVDLGGGNVTVDSFDIDTDGDGSTGILATSLSYYNSITNTTYVGNVYVDSVFVETSGDFSAGIDATSVGGNVDIESYYVSTYGDHAPGIIASTYMAYAPEVPAQLVGNIYIDAGAVVTTGYDSEGIAAYAEGGSIYIEAGLVSTSGDFAEGIYARAEYYYDATLLAGYSGQVVIDAGSVSTSGDFSDGITAIAEGGAVTVYAGSVSVYGLGSDAIVANAGTVSGFHDAFVGTTGTIYSYDGVGISVYASDDADIFVYSGSVYGYDWGIQVESGDSTYIYNDGSISGGGGAAIDADGGEAYITNYGQIYGYVDLTDNGDTLVNYDLWEAYGTSEFRGGADYVFNDGGVVGFSRYQGAASTTNMYDLEYFYTSGVVSGVDNQAGDYLYMPQTYFYGYGDSELHLDVQLGGPGSIADVLVIGEAGGFTEIIPNDLLSGSPGVLNFGGILVVDSLSNETGDEFGMDNVDKGFVEYELFFDAAADDWLIVGLPDDEAFEMLMVASASQDFWRRSGDAMSARWQEIRDSGVGMGMGPGGMTRGEGWELWMQAHGGSEEFEEETTFEIFGFSFTQELDYDSDWAGFQFGADHLMGSTLWGFTVGFVQQESDFAFDGNSLDFEGWNIGGYFGWSSGGFFLNGLIKGDFYEVDANFTTIPTYFTFDGSTWGLKGELGYRWDGGDWFFEPIVGLHWTTTDLDDASSFGATFSWDDVDSLQGRAGARIGGTFGSGDVVLTPYIGVYAIEEFDGENEMTMTTGPVSFTIESEQRRGYGMVDFGFTAQTFYGLEGFLKGEWNFGGDADGGAARLGARWRW